MKDGHGRHHIDRDMRRELKDMHEVGHQSSGIDRFGYDGFRMQELILE